jgi:hypothetical protein
MYPKRPKNLFWPKSKFENLAKMSFLAIFRMKNAQNHKYYTFLESAHQDSSIDTHTGRTKF